LKKQHIAYAKIIQMQLTNIILIYILIYIE